MCWRLISDGRKHSIQCARLERVGPLGYVQHEVGLGDQKKKNNLKKGGGGVDWVLLLLISCVCVCLCVCVAKFIKKFLSLSLFCKSVNKNNERTER